MHSVSNDQIIQAVFTATDQAKSRALAILQGRGESPSRPPVPIETPLLMGMGDSAKFLGVSRATLWRMIRDGRLTKVEIYHNAFRLRRSDILALVKGGDGSPRRPLSHCTAGGPPASLSADRCPPLSHCTAGVSSRDHVVAERGSRRPAIPNNHTTSGLKPQVSSLNSEAPHG